MSNIQWTDKTWVHYMHESNKRGVCQSGGTENWCALKRILGACGSVTQMVLCLQGLARRIRFRTRQDPIRWPDIILQGESQRGCATIIRTTNICDSQHRPIICASQRRRPRPGQTPCKLLCRSGPDTSSQRPSVYRLWSRLASERSAA